MTDEPRAVFQTKDGPKEFIVRRGPPTIEVSEETLHVRDGVKPGGDDVPSTVQIVEDSRGRSRSVVPSGEQSTYKTHDYEVKDVIPTPDGRGGTTRRYRLKRKG